MKPYLIRATIGMLSSLSLSFFVGYFAGLREGRKPNIKNGVWVRIQMAPSGGYRVAEITNAYTAPQGVFVTNLNIQGWSK